MKKVIYILGAIILVAVASMFIDKNQPDETTNKTDINNIKPALAQQQSDTTSSNHELKGNIVLFLRPSDEVFKTLEDEPGIFEADSDFGFGITRTIDSLDQHTDFKNLKHEVYTQRYITIKDCKDCPKTIDRDSIYYGVLLSKPNKEIMIIENLHSLDYIPSIREYFDLK